MNNFTLSNAVDKDKVFLVNLSEIEGRLDPYFYSPKFKDLSKKLKKKSNCNLGSLVHFSNETWNQKDIFDKKFPYIEISEINTTTGDIGEVKYVIKSEAPSRAKKIVRENDIIISTTRPNRGAISFINYKHNLHIASTGFSVLREIKNNKILKEYLFYILRQSFTLMQMEQRSSGGNYPAITEEELRKIIIPILSDKKQEKVINIIQIAKQSKQQKEAEAEKLLNSIDDYLLDELGITLPEKDNSLQNRIFTTSLSKISGGRFDPKLYDNNTQALRIAISKSKFSTSKLKDFIIQSFAGNWGKDEKEKLGDNYTKCLVIRATEFDNQYNLNLDNSRVKYRLIHKDKLAKIDIQPNDLLIEKSGGSPDQPVGRIAILQDDILEGNNICYSNFIHKIRVSDSINPEYLFCFLKTVHNIKLTDAMQSQTNGIRNLIMSNYINQEIPIPPIEKQNEIAEHISQIRNKAKQLQKEAVIELEKAKQKVEKMILETDKQTE